MNEFEIVIETSRDTFLWSNRIQISVIITANDREEAEERAKEMLDEVKLGVRRTRIVEVKPHDGTDTI